MNDFEQECPGRSLALRENWLYECTLLTDKMTNIETISNESNKAKSLCEVI